MIKSVGLRINDERTLRNILWADTALGTLAALVGFVFVRGLSPPLGVSFSPIVIISLVTAVYGVGAFALAVQTPLSVPLVQVLVAANWSWPLSAPPCSSRTSPPRLFSASCFSFRRWGSSGGSPTIEGRQLVR